MNIGFVGLGAMGLPMARNLLRAGHALRVWARRPQAAAPLVAEGAVLCADAATLAAGCEVMFTMVTHGKDVEGVVLGPGGLAAGALPDSVVVDCSTIPPAVARRVAEALGARGVHMLDAPVSGGEPGARDGTLSIMVGGPAPVYARVRPLLECLGRTLVHVGGHGAGQVAKAANQLSLVVAIQAAAEACLYANAHGVDFARVLEALDDGPAASRMLQIVGSRMQAHAYEAGIEARLHHKDANIVLACAAESCSYVPAVALAAQTFNALMARPGVRWDSAATRCVLEALSGLPSAPPPAAAGVAEAGPGPAPA